MTGTFDAEIGERQNLCAEEDRPVRSEQLSDPSGRGGQAQAGPAGELEQIVFRIVDVRERRARTGSG